MNPSSVGVLVFIVGFDFKNLITSFKGEKNDTVRLNSFLKATMPQNIHGTVFVTKSQLNLLLNYCFVLQLSFVKKKL